MTNDDMMDLLAEAANLTKLHQTLGGNGKAGSVDKILGAKYVERISLMREIDIGRTQIKNLIEASTKIGPDAQIASRALKNALKQLENAYEEMNKKISSFNFIDINGNVTNSKR